MEQTEIKKSVLVIKANAASLGTVEGFLRNRDWKIKATTNLKEALIFLVQEQPQFVMISVDHPNKKVQKLPKILKQAFPVCVITFAEESSAASFKMLSASGAEYMIYPPVTGPAVERTANKYYKDLQNKGPAAQRERLEGAEDGEDGVIAIRGSNQGFGGSNAQNILAQLLNEDGATSVASGSNSATGINGVPGSETNPPSSVAMAPGSTPGTPSSATMNGQGNAYEQSSAMTSGLNGLGSKASALSTGNSIPGQTSALNSGSKGTQSAALNPGDSIASQLSAVSPGTVGKDMGMAGQGLGAGVQHSSDEEGHGSAKGLSARQSGAGAGKGGGWVPLPTQEKQKPRLTPEQIEQDQRATKTDSVILRGTTEALHKACVKTTFKESQALTTSTNVACIVIESPRFSGYLITAMAKDKVIDATFIEKINQRLFRFLRENGEKIADKEALNINIKQVPFEDWALEYADFLRKSVHEGNEVAMAFFPRADIKTKTGASVADEMATIRVEELVGNAAVEFNLYVYLPRNNKFVLYTPRGGVFYNMQKDRLLGQGISQLHIFKSDIHDLEKYRAQNFLNDKISEFEHRQRLKESA
ncbi:MAG TPA: hypothetical protein VGE46_03005 [Bdellovibrio sp.]